jgi:hypothetical protein
VTGGAWITAAEAKAGQLVHLPYAGKDLAVWDVARDDGDVILHGSAAVAARATTGGPRRGGSVFAVVAGGRGGG